jgi:hypothetical protein
LAVGARGLRAPADPELLPHALKLIQRAPDEYAGPE